MASLPFDVASRAVGAAARPTEALAGTREALEGIGEIVWAGLNPAPETPLNVEIGPHRRLVWVRHELSDFKRVKDAFGGTVNDVVLTVAAGALRSWLRSRGVRTEGLELRALVPVSIRGGDQRNQMGNRIAAMRAPLPVYVEDPVARLRVVRQAMDGLKDSKQALGAEVLAGHAGARAADDLRPGIAAELLHAPVQPARHERARAAGPALRARTPAADLFPVAFLPKRHALAVAIMSYNGGMDFGLLGDYDAMPDLEDLGEMFGASLAELLAAAGESKGNGKVSSRARTSRPRTSSPATTGA